MSANWRVADYADLGLFKTALVGWRKQFINNASLQKACQDPFVLRAMFPGLARKAMKMTIAGEVNVDNVPISTYKSDVRSSYFEIWKDGKVPVVLYRSTGPSVCRVPQNVLFQSVDRMIDPSNLPIEELYTTPYDYEQWRDTIIMSIGEARLKLFKETVEKSFIDFIKAANDALKPNADLKSRYMGVIEAICCVAKFGQLKDCEEFGKECHKLDVMEQDKSDPQGWMDEDVRLACLQRLNANREKFRALIKGALRVIKFETLRMMYVHLASLLYVFNQYQLPLAMTEREAVEQHMVDGDPFEKMILEIDDELRDE